MPIAEMEVGSGHSIQFTAFTSCLGIVCVLDNGQVAGAHLVKDREGETDTLLKNLATAVGSNKVTGMYVVGVQSVWSEGQVTFGALLEKLCGAFNNDRLDTLATSGEGEVVSVGIASTTEIDLSITYPGSAKEKQNAGTRRKPRSPDSLGVL